MQYFVDPSSGVDTSSGVLASPFKTLSRAAAVAKAGDVVTMRNGVFRETVAVPNGVTLNALAGEVAAINGADIVTGWASESPGIWKVAMPWTLGIGSDQLFCDGVMVNEGF